MDGFDEILQRSPELPLAIDGPLGSNAVPFVELFDEKFGRFTRDRPASVFEALCKVVEVIEEHRAESGEEVVVLDSDIGTILVYTD